MHQIIRHRLIQHWEFKICFRRVRDHCNLPLAAYNVSGEFAMIKAAAQNGWIDERRVTMEVLTGIRRAGADMIITYFAPDVAMWLKE